MPSISEEFSLETHRGKTFTSTALTHELSLRWRKQNPISGGLKTFLELHHSMCSLLHFFPSSCFRLGWQPLVMGFIWLSASWQASYKRENLAGHSVFLYLLDSAMVSWTARERFRWYPPYLRCVTECIQENWGRCISCLDLHFRFVIFVAFLSSSEN